MDNGILKGKGTRVCTRKYESGLLSCKRSQEEMVGFILIIVLVTVVGLVFLGISLNKTDEKIPSSEINSFIQSSLRYSTDCFSTPEQRLDLKELIGACQKNSQCLDGNNSCEYLNKTVSEMIKTGWRIGPESKYRAYGLKIYNKDMNTTIVEQSYGNQTGEALLGDSPIPFASDTIKFELTIYYQN